MDSKVIYLDSKLPQSNIFGLISETKLAARVITLIVTIMRLIERVCSTKMRCSVVFNDYRISGLRSSSKFNIFSLKPLELGIFGILKVCSGKSGTICARKISLRQKKCHDSIEIIIFHYITFRRCLLS